MIIPKYYGKIKAMFQTTNQFSSEQPSPESFWLIRRLLRLHRELPSKVPCGEGDQGALADPYLSISG